MVQSPYLMGIDLGTSSCKCVVFDLKGRSIARASAEIPFETLGDGWAEQDADKWWNATCSSIKSCIKEYGINPENILSIAVSGHGPSVVSVDRSGNSLGKSLIWMDRRAVREADLLRRRFGEQELYEYTGHRIDSSTSLAKILWIKKNRPKIYSKTFKFMSTSGYIVLKLTENFTLDYSQASTGLLVDICSKRILDDYLDRLSLSSDKIPNLYESIDVVGEVVSKSSSQTGLKMGTPVVAGGIDGLCGSIGAGSIRQGTLYNICGTSDVFILPVDQPIFDSKRRLCCTISVLPDYWAIWGAMSTTGASIEWFVKSFLEKQSFETFFSFAKGSTPGSEGVIFIPYMMGERSPIWNPDAKGALYGLTLKNRLNDISRAILEGIAFGIRQNLEVLDEMGLEIDEVTVTGKTMNEFWCQIKADILRRKIRLISIQDPSALGAAILAGLGVKSLRRVEDFFEEDICKELTFTPRKRFTSRYERLYKLYKELSDLTTLKD